MEKPIKIQELLSMDRMSNMLCSFEIDRISEDASPLIHPMSRLWLVTEGEGELLLNNKKYALKKGTLVSILPWQISELVNVREPIQLYVVEYYYDGVMEILKTFYNPDETQISVVECLENTPVFYAGEEQYEEVIRTFHQLRKEINQLEEHRAKKDNVDYQNEGIGNLYLTNKLIEILIYFLRSPRTGVLDEDLDSTEILRYMFKNLSEKLTTTTLAQRFYMSESSIRSYIKRTTGMSFTDLLNEMRVGKTINYLLYTDFTMNELAEILGFVDDAHVCNVFRDRMGMKTSEFRDTYQMVAGKCHFRDREIFYKMVEYIYRNHMEDLTAQSVSMEFHTTAKELNRILQYQVERNFNDFLNYVRVNHAARLLLETDKSILTIALEVGYKTEKTLSRNFLKVHGISPGKFRKNVKLEL